MCDIRIASNQSYTYIVCMQDSMTKSPRSKGTRARTSAAASSPRLVRKQLLLTPDQNRQLRSLAVTTARSEGDLVREAVDQWLAKHQAEQEDWKAALRKLCGIWKDRTDLDEFYAGNRNRRRLRRERVKRLSTAEDPIRDE